MSTEETYEGWANRETWAFNLHWSNDEGLYTMVREFGADHVQRIEDEDESLEDRNYELGRAVIDYMRDFIDAYEEDFGSKLPDELRMFDREVGSWWRVDEAEIGASVRESLS